MHKIEKLLIEKTQYQGNTEPNRKAISASEFGSDIRQIWLRQKYGIIKSDTFGQDTIGSICHAGIQELLKKEYLSEYDIDIEMPNSWHLTGSIDLLNIKDKEFFDIKVTKQYTVEKLHSEPNHNYIWQLSVYRYLLYKHFGFDFEGSLLLVLKDGGFNFRKMMDEPSIEVIKPHLKTYNEVENKFNEIISQLEQYSNSEPPQCSDLWFRKTSNGSIPVRCFKYCSYNEVCSKYNPNPTKINF